MKATEGKVAYLRQTSVFTKDFLEGVLFYFYFFDCDRRNMTFFFPS